MSKLEDEFRDALGLRRREDGEQKGVFRRGTGVAVDTITQLAQHQIYADMHAGSMGAEMDNVVEKPRVYTESVTRKVSARPLPKSIENEPTADDYDFVPGT